MATVKSHLQTCLTRAGLYQRVKASCLYDLYWRVADRRIIDARLREVEFYRDLLKGFRAGELVFDIGANHGSKTATFLNLGARVVAVEPDEINQEILRQKFLTRRLASRPVIIVDKAVSDSNTVETMWIDAPGSAKNTFSKKWVETLKHDPSRFGKRLDFAQQKTIATVTLEQLIATHGRPFFVKIDVEGSEPSVLRGLKSPVPYLSFEVNLPEFEPEGLECVDLLRRLHPAGTFNYAADCQHGLTLDRWLDAPAFARVLGRSTEKSIEVFWRGPRASSAQSLDGCHGD
jgi:FkbM family methyltransferase